MEKAKTNVDKAINCLQMDRLNEKKDLNMLYIARRYIEKEIDERKEAKRLADRKASSN